MEKFDLEWFLRCLEGAIEAESWDRMKQAVATGREKYTQLKEQGIMTIYCS